MNIILVLPDPSPSQNVYQRWHWAKQRKYKNYVRMEIRAQLHELGMFNPDRPTERTTVIVRRYSSRKLDRGNFIGGCKPIIDALTQENVIRDDTEEWLEDGYKQIKCGRIAARTEIEVVR